MIGFVKTRYPAILTVCLVFAVCIVAVYSALPSMMARASLTAAFTNTGAAADTVIGSETNIKVMNVLIPDAWNGVAYTADTLYVAGDTAYWQGDTLNAFPALGTTSGVGFVDSDAGVDFDATEAVVRDLDADSVYTVNADITYIEGTDAPVAGQTLYNVVAGDNVCSNSHDLAAVINPNPCVYIDNEGVCGAGTEDTHILGAADCDDAGDVLIVTGDNWATTDDAPDAATTDYIKEIVAEEFTYSAAADTDVYSTGVAPGAALINFPADCDGAGAGAQACLYTGLTPITSDEAIYIDDGTAGGAAPNAVVDKRADRLVGIGVRNTGTAVDIIDLSAIKVWADDGDGTFEPAGDDAPALGTMTVRSTDTKEWRLGGLTTAVGNGGQRIFISADFAAAPTNARTAIFSIPTYNDIGANGIATSDGDVGVFMASNNDGPSDSAITNAATQTIDSTPPTVTISLADTALSVGETTTVTITFSEAVSGFANADITTINNGTMSAVASADGNITFTSTFTPTVEIDDATNVITINKALLTDVPGNAGVGTTSSANYTVYTLSRNYGSSAPAPTVTFNINNSAAETNSTAVTLNINAVNATEMVIGNDANFAGSVWEPVVATKAWTLPAGLGNKTVYVNVRNVAQTLGTVVSNTIKLVDATVVPVVDVNTSTVVTDKASALSDGVAKITATVTAKLNNGAVAAGKTVVLTSSRTVEDKVVAINATTDANGIAKFEVTSAFEGVSTLMASIGGVALSKTASVQFTKIAVAPDEQVDLVDLSVGDLIKCSDNGSAVYYYGADGKRHSFATSTIYYSYYTDFSGVKEISAVQMAGIGLGANAKVRPGTWMIKIQSDPKVYAVTPAGILRWVKTEQIAKALYGTTWNKKIIDIDAGFFQDYAIGDAIETSSHPSASLIQYDGGSVAYYISNGQKRKVADTTAFNANRFQNKFKQVVSTALTYTDGSDITEKESAISEVVY